MGIVPTKPPNKAGEILAAEVVEGRPVTKENIVESNTRPTQSGERVSQRLHGVREQGKTSRSGSPLCSIM